MYRVDDETLTGGSSLQTTMRYGILISLVQGLRLGFTYGLAICSCALQLWVYTDRLTPKNIPLWTDMLKHRTGFTESHLLL
jgi:hypothetical protein